MKLNYEDFKKAVEFEGVRRPSIEIENSWHFYLTNDDLNLSLVLMSDISNNSVVTLQIDTAFRLKKLSMIKEAIDL